MRSVMLTLSPLALLGASAAHAEESYASWPILVNPFESTGGGGIIYRRLPARGDGRGLHHRLHATEPNGTVHHNTIAFDAVPVQGGILCTNGKWRSKDGSASGTTPFRVFVKDGVVRRSP